MEIIYTSIFVDDQDKALNFYTTILGFIKKNDVPLGQYRWITLVSPSGHSSTELVLEPNDNPAARDYQKAIFEQGIPATSFGVGDVRKEYERLKGLGVAFVMEPTEIMENVTIARFNDTCGNLIQIQSVQINK